VITPPERAAMQAVTSARWRVDGPYVQTHVGDIAWGANPARAEVSAHLLGDEAYVFLDDPVWRVCAVPGAEHRFAEAAALARDAGAGVYALEHERPKAAALREAGFVRDDSAWFWHLVRDLSDLPPVTLPPGAAVCDGASDPAARVEVHRAAWEPSRFTLELYDSVRATPPYRDELDVGVVAADGTWGGYCLSWLDADSRSGELEPVGTAPAYRRRGYAAAACLTALHRLRDAGATTAVVYAVSDPANQGPRRLYESLGFVAEDRHVRYLPPMRENPATR
jgi:ribosomal protein S18 acetylase RimI-like enzyme